MEKGLTSLEVQEKQKIFGKNEIKAEERISTAILFLSQFPTFINGIWLWPLFFPLSSETRLMERLF